MVPNALSTDLTTVLLFIFTLTSLGCNGTIITGADYINIAGIICGDTSRDLIPTVIFPVSVSDIQRDYGNGGIVM